MNVKGIIKGTLLSYIVTAVVLLGGAALVYFNVIEERAASIAVFAGVVIGVFIGAFGAAKAAEGKRLINAFAVGLGFAAVVFIAATAVNGAVGLSARAAALMGSVGAAAVVAAIFSR